jgi:hypothetical protein
MPGPGSLEEVTALLRAPDSPAVLAWLCQQVMPGQTGPSDQIVGLVWATPDIEATRRRVVAPFTSLTRDRLLGGSAVQVRFGRIALLLEQPDAEAGVAAYVSRYGEGVAAVYLERPRFMPSTSPNGRPPRPTRSPFPDRRGWLLPHEWPWGPFVIALESAR